MSPGRRARWLATAISATASLSLLTGCGPFAGEHASTWSSRTQSAFADLLVDGDPYPAVRTTDRRLTAYEAARLVQAATRLDVATADLAPLVEHLRDVWRPGSPPADSPIPATATDAVVIEALRGRGIEIGSTQRRAAIAAARAALDGDDLADASAARVLVALDAPTAVGRRPADRCVHATDAWTLAGAARSARLLDAPCRPDPELVASAVADWRASPPDPSGVQPDDAALLHMGLELVRLGALSERDWRARLDSVLDALRDDRAVPDPALVADVGRAADVAHRSLSVGPRVRQAIERATRWTERLTDDVDLDPWALLALIDLFRVVPGGATPATVERRVDWDSPAWTATDRLLLAAVLAPDRIRSDDWGLLDADRTGVLARALEPIANGRFAGDHFRCPAGVVRYAQRLARDADVVPSARALGVATTRRCGAMLRSSSTAASGAPSLRTAVRAGERSDDVLVVADALEARCRLDGDVHVARDRLRELAEPAADERFGARQGASSLVTVDASRAVAIVLAVRRAGCAGLGTADLGDAGLEGT